MPTSDYICFPLDKIPIFKLTSDNIVKFFGAFVNTQSLSSTVLTSSANGHESENDSQVPF